LAEAKGEKREKEENSCSAKNGRTEKKREFREPKKDAGLRRNLERDKGKKGRQISG